MKSIISEDRFQTEMDREAIFEVVLERTKLTSNESIGWDEIEGDLFSVLKLFAKDEKYREWLKQVFLSRTTEDNRYRNSLILGFIYELIEKYESEQEKLSFLKHNKILDTLCYYKIA